MNGNESGIRYTLRDGARHADAVIAAADVLSSLLRPHEAPVLLVSGAPRCGKTTFAFDALMHGLRAEDGGTSTMVVQNRRVADLLGDEAIRRVGSLSQARPVTTLSAIAFRIISAIRKRTNEPLPRLLNGAEQDAMLRTVTDSHVGHVRSGDPCGTCMLLRDYFGVDEWEDVLSGGEHADGEVTAPGLSDAFIMQLRDMLSRMNELGVSRRNEPEILASLGDWTPHVERLRVQWRLAFALRRQYEDLIGRTYVDELRLDSSSLLVEGTTAIGMASDDDLPRLLVVDDFQDLTLAGFSFLEALHDRGVPLVLVGNPDEAVQTFRGSYPDYLFAQARERFGARRLRIERAEAGTTVRDPRERSGSVKGSPCYRDLIASRISLSIQPDLDDDLALPERPGKLPRLAGSLPISTSEESETLSRDGSLRTALYRSETEELDDVVWHIKRARLTGGLAWNDMAVIAHDNATVRRFGERLRRDGVPVRYSSVSRPLRDESFVQGLFALLELAHMRRRTLYDMTMSLSAAAAFVRSRVATLMGCPLIGVGATRSHEGRPARLSGVEAAMGALDSLAGIVDDDGNGRVTGDSGTVPDDHASSLVALMNRWTALRDDALTRRREGNVEHDDTLVDGDGSGDDLPFGIDALYLMLEFDDADAVLAAIQSVCGSDPHAKAFAHLWNLVSTVDAGLRALPSDEPQYALTVAWNACAVADRWQREALDNTDDGRTANDRLDTAMRLFDYAAGSASSDDWREFIGQVRSMRIEADSLAKVAPVDQAVTLTTPAGAAGRCWSRVWIPAVQQDVWPNLAARNTMFGGEELADMMLFGRIFDGADVALDPGLRSVLSSEQKSLLVAVTRAESEVTVSAVCNDALTPSDFLYGYLPERFDRKNHAQPNQREYARVAGNDRFGGMDGTPRGLVAAARTVLATQPHDSTQWRDALDALHVLRDHGIAAADPRNWPFVDDGARGADRHEERSESEPNPDMTVTMSPSDVDAIWACPVCWLMERRFSGPRAGTVEASFGSLIHAVAQRASEEGLDLPSAFPDLSVDGRVKAVTDRMMEIYRELAKQPSPGTEASLRYGAARKDATARDVLERIASYFVRSNTGDYLAGNSGSFSVGTLTSAECERSFAARFSLDDILAAYRRIPGAEHTTRHELTAIMGMLVGGWPQGMDEGLVIRLTGRIDRLEHRTLPDGAERIRLIDYKTGGVPSVKGIFNDLQLVCYQLGLIFPEHDSRKDSATAPWPDIAQSALFHVASNDAPAQSYAPESLYQPALFLADRLNDDTFTPRYHYRDPATLMDIPDLNTDPPAGIGDAAWRSFLTLRGTQATWALTMISRVFYAAAASRSASLTAHPTPSHLKHCRMKEACPACAGQVDTVFETRQP